MALSAARRLNAKLYGSAMTFHATDLMGASVLEPTVAQMRVLLQSLDHSEAEHPDVALSHESEWCLSVFESGLVVFENLESGAGPFHLPGVSRERVLQLWQMLAAGRISELQELPWLPGYGAA
jgi:hypothetical protein